MQMPHMVVIDQNGVEHIIEGRTDCKVMETLREFAFGVPAICGGLCSCATCHVYIDSSWMARLPAKSPSEQDMLTDLSHYHPPASRLSCQLVFTPTLHGLKLTIPPDE
jgi:2Fe-2S ferredoxin